MLLLYAAICSHCQQATATMTLLGSYDPDLMLFNGNPMTEDIVELLQIDIHSHWLKTHGKARLFSYFDYLYSDLDHRRSVSSELAILLLFLLILMATVITHLLPLLHTWANNYQRMREETYETSDDVLTIRNQHLQNRMANLTDNQTRRRLAENEENE